MNRSWKLAAAGVLAASGIGYVMTHSPSSQPAPQAANSAPTAFLPIPEPHPAHPETPANQVKIAPIPSASVSGSDERERANYDIGGNDLRPQREGRVVIGADIQAAFQAAAAQSGLTADDDRLSPCEIRTELFPPAAGQLPSGENWSSSCAPETLKNTLADIISGQAELAASLAASVEPSASSPAVLNSFKITVPQRDGGSITLNIVCNVDRRVGVLSSCNMAPGPG